MKIERLLSIIVILLERKKVPAPRLAEIFEVSTRTIYRDIDTLNAGSRSISTVWQFHIGSHIIRAVALVQFQGILRIVSSKGGVGDGHHRILNTAQVPVDTVFQPARTSIELAVVNRQGLAVGQVHKRRVSLIIRRIAIELTPLQG